MKADRLAEGVNKKCHNSWTECEWSQSCFQVQSLLRFKVSGTLYAINNSNNLNLEEQHSHLSCVVTNCVGGLEGHSVSHPLRNPETGWKKVRDPN